MELKEEEDMGRCDNDDEPNRPRIVLTKSEKAKLKKEIIILCRKKSNKLKPPYSFTY